MCSRALTATKTTLCLCGNVAMILTKAHASIDTLQNGIPAGGLFSGAEVPKTMDERHLFGGLANSAYDACYHEPCDDMYNINTAGYSQMARAAAYASYKV
jgi:hypothetical protein